MTKPKLQSFESVIDDLRAKGELDDEKLKLFESSVKFRVIYLTSFALILVVAFFFGEKATGTEYLLIALLGLCWFTYCVVKSCQLFAILFSMGEKSDAVVTKYSIFRGRILLEYTIIINGISYYHFAKTQGFKRKYMSSGCANQAPKDGDNITALYLKENPAINCVWLQKLDDLYNLRKK